MKNKIIQILIIINCLFVSKNIIAQTNNISSNGPLDGVCLSISEGSFSDVSQSGKQTVIYFDGRGIIYEHKNDITKILTETNISKEQIKTILSILDKYDVINYPGHFHEGSIISPGTSTSIFFRLHETDNPSFIEYVHTAENNIYKPKNYQEFYSELNNELNKIFYL